MRLRLYFFASTLLSGFACLDSLGCLFELIVDRSDMPDLMQLSIGVCHCLWLDLSHFISLNLWNDDLLLKSFSNS